MSTEQGEDQVRRWYDSILEQFAGPIGFIRSPWVVAIIVAVIILGAIVVGWRRLGPGILQHPITLEMIEVSSQPSWIHAKVKSEVFRDGSFDDLSLHDSHLLEKIADAFAVHSWVAEVVRVRKNHDKVVVELRYRRPVAMVEVTTNGEPGLVPVDADGIILPTADFSQNQTRDYLRISIPDVKSFGMVGTIWGDDRVSEAAGIADAWGTDWKKVKLYRIVATDRLVSRRAAGDTEYELHTRDGARVIWGRSIGQEIAGEASASQKVAQAVEYVQQHGALDDKSGMKHLDVRGGIAKVISPQTANRKVRN